MTRPLIRSSLCVSLALVAAVSALARPKPRRTNLTRQAVAAPAPRLTERLPAGTFFYVYWRGAQSISPSSQNALVALWNDPNFGPGRMVVEKGIVDAIHTQHKLQMPATEIQALLGRPMIFGARLVEPGPSAKAGAKTQVYGFLVVQAGRQIGEELRSALTGEGPKVASHIRLTPSGYLVASPDAATRDDLAARFGGAAPAASSSLAGLPAYREARAEIAGQPAVEFFLRIPDLSKFHPPASPNFDMVAFLNALHVDRVHAICGALDLNASHALLHGAILGDASPGSPFDLFGASAENFSTLAVAPSGASFTASRLDLGTFVTDVLNALSVAMKPDQLDRIKMMAGMFTSSVLPALGGEYATIRPTTSGTQGMRDTLIALTIHSQAADQLFSSTLAPFLQPAGQEGEVRFFRVAPPGASATPTSADGQPQAGAGSGQAGVKSSAASSLFIALTPQLVLASANEQLVRASAHAATAAAPSATGLAADPNFRAARAELPAALTGLAYVDFTRVPWTGELQKIAAALRKQKKSSSAGQLANQIDSAAFEKWVDSGEAAAVLERHLHWFVIGSWKNSTGLHTRGDIH